MTNKLDVSQPGRSQKRPASTRKNSQPRTMTRSRLQGMTLASLSVACGLLVWQAAAMTIASSLLPSPVAVIATMAQLGLSVGLHNVLASLRRVTVGFIAGSAIGIFVGLLMGWYGVIRTALDPWIQFFRCIPPLAMIPLFILLLGIGELPKYVVIGVAAFLPTTVAVAQGVLDVDRSLINAARVLGARQLSIFFRVIIPAASPVILVGLRLALGNCWGTLVAAELIASRSGLGYMTSQGALYFDVPEIFLGIALIGVCGITMDRALYGLQQRLTDWQERR